MLGQICGPFVKFWFKNLFSVSPSDACDEEKSKSDENGTINESEHQEKYFDASQSETSSGVFSRESEGHYVTKFSKPKFGLLRKVNLALTRMFGSKL